MNRVQLLDAIDAGDAGDDSEPRVFEKVDCHFCCGTGEGLTERTSCSACRGRGWLTHEVQS